MNGLTSAQAKEILAEEGFNTLPQARNEGLLRQLVDVLAEPMLLLLAAAGVINFFLSEVLDAAILMLTVCIIVGISFVQERKTKKALSALMELSSPTAHVFRDGIEIAIPTKEVVRGDLIALREGDRIPADARIISSSNLSVDESMLTGESLPISKKVDGAVYSGTLVVKGHGRAEVVEIGTASELGKIGQSLAEIQIERTHLQQEVDRIVKYVAIASLVAAVAVVVIYGATRGDWLEGALAGIAAAMALVPEEFPVIMTVFLALGAWRMSKVGVISRRTPAIETLGSVTVLCVDKTGTLTMNQMVVAEGSEEAKNFGLLASPLHPFDPMDIAFEEVAERDDSWELVREYPLSEELLAITHAWKVPGQSNLTIAAKGAPEAIARLCKLNDQVRDGIIKEVDAAASKGFRVLAVAKGEHAGELPYEPSDLELTYVGLIHLHDPVRSGVKASVADLARAGVRTIMLTGDYPGTALSIADEIGIERSAGVITGTELDQLSDQDLAARIKNVNLFARVVPTQKLRLVRALQADGEIVGMTGDGVNDAPALRAANIGIAMGLRGTDVAREAAALVITDDDFTTIANGIRMGRRIYANIRKAMSFVISVHIPIFAMALIPVFVLDWPLVLLPAQIAFLELIIDPASSVVYEAEDGDPNLMSAKPRNITEKVINKTIFTSALIQGLILLLHTLAIYFWSIHSGKSDDLVRSLTFATLMIGNICLVLTNRSRTLTILETVRSRSNPTVRWIMAGGVLILLSLFNISWFQQAFNLEHLTLSDWAIVLFVGISSVSWSEIKKVRSRYK